MRRIDLDPKIKQALVKILGEHNPDWPEWRCNGAVEEVLEKGVHALYWDEVSAAFWEYIEPIANLLMPIVHQMIAAAVPAVMMRAEEINKEEEQDDDDGEVNPHEREAIHWDEQGVSGYEL